jgi:hypothetical protein
MQCLILTNIACSARATVSACSNRLPPSPIIRNSGAGVPKFRTDWPIQAPRLVRGAWTMRHACRFALPIAALCSAHILWGWSQPAFAQDFASVRAHSRNGSGHSNDSGYSSHRPVVRQPAGLLCDSVVAEICFGALAGRMAEESAQKPNSSHP